MLAGLIQNHHGVRAGCHSAADLLKMGLHGRGIAPGHHQARALALGRADGAEDISRDRALVVWSARTRATFGPSAGQLVLLSDARFVLEPDLYFDARSDLCLDRRQFGGEVFLNAAIASASWA